MRSHLKTLNVTYRLTLSLFLPLQAQIESMKKQISKLQTKGSQRHNALVNTLEETEKFDNLTQNLQREISAAFAQIESLKPIASEVQTIKKQQQEFKVLITTIVHQVCYHAKID